MRLSFLMALCIALNFSAPSYAFETLNPYIPAAQKVGEGRMSYMVWDVYDASLYAPNGQLGEGKPFALKLSYLLALKGKKIADRSIKEMKKQENFEKATLDSWHEQMTQIFPDVRSGDSLIGVFTQNQETVFYKDNKKIGTIKDPKFSRAFFNIWLSEQTSAPNLRKKLLGKV